MALWVVRAGKHGEQQETALQKGLVTHAWNELPDYGACKTREDLKQLYAKTYPQESEAKRANGAGQVWRFAREIAIGDLVALPLKTESAIAFGRVVGPYEYEHIAPNVMHIRRVQWLKTVPRSVFDKDILFSMGSVLTLFQVTRNDAESRVKATLNGQVPVAAPPANDPSDAEVSAPLDIEQTAQDEIIKFIEAKFKGHDLARLVDAILRAQGYKTFVSPPGPDGGVDILAGSGPLGFDAPRLCVQVKSGSGAQGQASFNELLGVVSKFDSEQGLLVSWGGFTGPVRQDARKQFFKIRLWDQGDVVSAILANYERIDEEIKAELPLKRVWVLVNEADD